MNRYIVNLCLTFSVIYFNHSVFADHASPGFETGSSGAINTMPGTTLTKGKVVIGVGVQFIELDDISDQTLEDSGALDEDVHSVNNLLNTTFNLAYGFTDDLTIGFRLPYVDRTDVRESHHDMGAGEAEFAGDSSGIGDLSIFGQFRFYNSGPMDASVIFGVKTPTGTTSEREIEGALFETEQQPGSGSWDPFAGISFNRSMGRTGVSGNILYTLVNEGSMNTDLGDIFNYNLAASFRPFSPEGGHDHHQHKHGLGIFDYLDLVLELNGDYREQVEINGISENNSGGHTLYISPGIRLGLGHSWSVYTSLGLPIVNDINGIQSEPDYRVIGGISKSF